MSERKKGEHHVDVSGENNPFYGKTHSLETRKKMREHHADVSGKKNPMYGKCGELSPIGFTKGRLKK